mmetsp:Transcript_26343/g.54897  ORF Transcript_26343/g.54897 Transcript_26343/m.54897 type:complete len:453 (+) Transcript_26343:175-1533(+)
MHAPQHAGLSPSFCVHPSSLTLTPEASKPVCRECFEEVLAPLLSRKQELELELTELRSSKPSKSPFAAVLSPQFTLDKLNRLRKEAIDLRNKNQTLGLEILKRQAEMPPDFSLESQLSTLKDLHTNILPPLLADYKTTRRTISHLIDLKLYQLLTSFDLVPSTSTTLPAILDIPWVQDLSRYFPPMPSSPNLRSYVLRTAPVVLNLVCSILMQMKSIALRAPGDSYMHTCDIEVLTLDGTRQISGVSDSYGNVYRLSTDADGSGSLHGGGPSRSRAASSPFPRAQSTTSSLLDSLRSSLSSSRGESSPTPSENYPASDDDDPFKVNSSSSPFRSRNPSIDKIIGGATVAVGGTLSAGRSLLLKGLGSLSSSQTASEGEHDPYNGGSASPDREGTMPEDHGIPKGFATGVTILASYIFRVCVDQGVAVEDLHSMDFISNLAKLRDLLKQRLGL